MSKNAKSSHKPTQTVVYTGGTFDLFHSGHVNFLKQCKKIAGPEGKVVVSLNPDEFIAKFKGKPPIMSFEERKKVLEACQYVDAVIKNTGGADSKPSILKVKPHFIVIGSDWAKKDYYTQMQFTQQWLDDHNITLTYVPYTENISTTAIKLRFEERIGTKKQSRSTNVPLVSVCMPMYNGSLYMRQAIESILRQTYENLEIIIADNASTDDTLSICQEYAKIDKRITIVKRKKTIPAIENFNDLMNRAKGKFMMWAAYDDAWNPLYIQRCVEEFLADKNQQIWLVNTRFAVMDQRGNVVEKQKASFGDLSGEELSFRQYIKEGFGGFKANVFFGMFRTEKIKSIGGWAELSPISASDILTMHTILTKGKVKLLKDTLFYKREFFLSGREAQWTDVLAPVFMMMRVVKNVFGAEHHFFLKHVGAYYKYNQKLITTHFGNSIGLRMANLWSTIQLWWTFVPNDIAALKNRDKAFLGK